MSAPAEEGPKTALPVADLSELERALRPRGPDLATVLKTLRPADVGRDLSRLILWRNFIGMSKWAVVILLTTWV